MSYGFIHIYFLNQGEKKMYMKFMKWVDNKYNK